MLTDLQIEQLADRMQIPLGGVYFKDELPKLIPNKTYIINLQDSETDDGTQNEGTHWTLLQVNKYPSGKIEPIFFDPYGAPPSESIKSAVKKQFNCYLPYTNKDIQSLMNNACGFYCLALGHFINVFKGRTNSLYNDVDMFMDMFEDLNQSIDFKKNEYILKHFFQSEDPKLRKEIDVLKPIESITEEDEKGGFDPFKNNKDMMRFDVDIKYINNK